VRRRFAPALGVLAVALGAVAAPASSAPTGVTRCHPRRHHPCPKPLPHRLEVDENDQGELPKPYSLVPSHNPVAAGKVQFNVYNFGEDPHTFAVLDGKGRRLAFVKVPANQPDTAIELQVKLPRGRFTLECTLSGHAHLGMQATLTVR